MAGAPNIPRIPRKPNSSTPSTCHMPEMSCRGAGADFAPFTGAATGRPQESTPGSSVWPSTVAEAQLNRLASPWQMGGSPLRSFVSLDCVWACINGENIKIATRTIACAIKFCIGEPPRFTPLRQIVHHQAAIRQHQPMDASDRLAVFGNHHRNRDFVARLQ